MTTLLLILTPISVLDSMSVVPLCIVPLAILLGGRQPLAGSLMFIAGIVVTYLPFGLLLLFGLDTAFDALGQMLVDYWYKEPDTLDLILQIVIGLVMLAFGYRMASARESHGERGATADMAPGQAFVLAAMLNVTGMWGALPYFAAIDQILRADLSAVSMVFVLVYYNLVFCLPLLAFIALRYALGKRADRLFQAATRFFTRWGRRLITVILLVLGLVLIVDGIGWFLGSPLIPV